MLTIKWLKTSLLSIKFRVFIFTGFIMICGFTTNWIEVQETPAAEFCTATNPPAINGSIGGVYTDANQYPIEHLLAGGISGAGDLSAYYQVVWDLNAIYIAVVVEDDTTINDSPNTDLTADDGIEVYIDGGNEKSSTYDGNDHHFLFRWNDNVVHDISGNTTNPVGVIADFLNTTAGYNYEIQINWSAINATPGSEIGIDIHINDDDDGGNTREAKLSWTCYAVDSAFSDPSRFGNGILDIAICGNDYPEYDPPLCADLDNALYHASGLLISHNNSFWTHNDKQGTNPPNDSILYEFDSTGAVLRELVLSGVENVDWEDLSRDKDGNFYVGEFGSGNSPYTSLYIYKIKDPLYECALSVVPEKISFRYPADGIAGDTEGMFHWNDSIYLFPKINSTDPAKAGRAFVYRIPDIPNPGGQYIAERVFDIDINPDNIMPLNTYKVQSADLSPDEKTVILLGGQRFWLLTDFTPGIFLDGKLTTIDFPSGWQREAVAFMNNTTIIIIDEDNNDNPNRGKIAKVDLCEIILDHPACSCNSRITTDAANTFMDLIEEREDGSVNNGSSDIELTLDEGVSSHQIIGLRFENLGIPQGAIIQKSYIQFTIDETDNNEASDLRIWGEATDDAAPFMNQANNVSNRSKTSASASWAFDDWTTVGNRTSKQRSIDFSNVVQEVIDRPNWSPDHAIVFMVEGDGSQTAESHYNCNNAAPRIFIEYCTGGPPCEAVIVLNNQIIPPKKYQSQELLFSNGIVYPRNMVEFKSNLIDLDINFEVVTGGLLSAFIDPCQQ